MSTRTEPETWAPDTGGPDELVHYWCNVCADPDISYCGKDISAEAEAPPGVEVDCVVCLDLHHYPCIRCGAI